MTDMTKFYQMPLEDLSEYIYEADMEAGEVRCQHNSECAAFGDSWPGAQLQIEQAEAWVQRLRNIYTWRINS